MYRQTAFIISWRGFPLTAFGRHRRHARNPAFSASWGARKKVTFSRLGRLEGQEARPIRFSADLQGIRPDPTVETEIRIIWSPEMLYLRFACRYRELFVFPDSDPNGRRDHLWDRDVAEAFLQPVPNQTRFYKEF